MASDGPTAALHAPLGLGLVAVLAWGWAVAGLAFLTDAPLLVGALFGVVALGVTIFWRVRR